MKSVETPALTGVYHVRVFRPAWGDAHHWLPRKRDRIELRDHALKLRYWPSGEENDGQGRVVDLNWSWIQSLSGLQVGELRIEDNIGGRDNLRIIFFKGAPSPCKPNSMPVIWILAVLQKKRMEFTRANIAIFRARRILVIERFYKNREFE